MKRALVVLGVAVLVLTPSAVQAEDTSVSTYFRSSEDAFQRGTTLMAVSSLQVTTAVGDRVPLDVVCFGPQCQPDRPARVEIARDGAWTTWAEGELQSLAQVPQPLRADSPVTISIRTILPAHNGLPELRSKTTQLRFLQRTTVRPVGKALIPPTKSAGWEFRPRAKAFTLRLTPAQAGRAVIVRNAKANGEWPIIARARTNARGEVTVKLPRVEKLFIIIKPTKERAGWMMEAAPAT